MRRTRPQLLPDPWVDPTVHAALISAAPFGWALGTWVVSANRAMYVPCVFPVRCTLYGLNFVAGNGTGNYDLGLYDASFLRIASTGSTAMTAAGLKTLALDNFSVEAGHLYYAALTLDNTSGSISRIPQTLTYPCEAGGCATEESAFPLPATATPVAAVLAAVPVFSWSVR